MPKRDVFFSFHFGNDVMRVQQIRNIGAVHGNEPISPNAWEEVKRKGDAAVEKWIDDNMYGKSCVIVLIGQETASRRWVNYEIKKAWDEKRAIFGIYINNIKCPRNGICIVGPNPFANIELKNGRMLSEYVKCYHPNSWSAYSDIALNIDSWIETAIQTKRQ